MNVAFIPAGGNTTIVPVKEVKNINGKPLIYWTMAAACDCMSIDEVYIATDDAEIKKVAERIKKSEGKRFNKVKIIKKSNKMIGTDAPAERYMIEFLQKHECDNIVLMPVNTPTITGSDLDDGFTLFGANDTDSVLSGIPQKRCLWSVGEDGTATAGNCDINTRTTEEDYEEYYVENGAFYITSREALVRSKNRISGRIKISLMNEDSLYDLDNPINWSAVEMIMKRREELEKEAYNHTEVTATAMNATDGDTYKECKYKMFLTDCDGCLTDGGMYYSEKGDELKKFNTKDGMGFVLLREAGIITGVVTGESVELNRRRCQKLKVDILAPGCIDKVTTIKNLCTRYNVDLSEVVYVGDDINDKAVIQMVGLGCCPQDASPKVKAVADYVAQAKGGEGVIREVVDMIMG